jgi:hypothetical protein
MKNHSFKFIAVIDENGNLIINIEAKPNPIAALKALEKINREVKRMRKDIFTKFEQNN